MKRKTLKNSINFWDYDTADNLNLKVNAKILALLFREAFNISLNIVISSKMK